MSEIFDEIQSRPPPQRVWSARIAKAPTDFADRVEVVIPGLDSGIRWEDCRWQARNTVDLPQRGDICLINIDDNNEVWVVAWWPF
jgi:hypothetical protein